MYRNHAVTDEIISQIYEAAALPERWPHLLDNIAHHVGARGGNVIRSSANGIELASSPRIEDLTRRFVEQGWNAHNTRVSRRLVQASYPGFLTDSNLHSAHELNTLPMYTDFLTPEGAAAGAGTVVQGGKNDSIVVAIEGFASHRASNAAKPRLDRLRPHLARSAMLSSQIRQARAASLIDAFNIMGTPAALLNANGRVLQASGTFAKAFDDILLDGKNRLRIVDAVADQRLAEGLRTMRWADRGCSIAVRDRDQIGRAVLHVLPARLDARDMFDDVRMFAVLAKHDNHSLPDADIIAALFDLTPAEARVARGIAENRSPGELASEWGISIETIRSQLKKAFSKTSTTRQSELAALLSRFGQPTGQHPNG